MLLKIGLIGKAYRHVQRYRQILTVLFNYGFDEIVQRLNIEQYIGISLRRLTHRDGSDERPQLKAHSTPERVRLALSALGPTFVKMGQILSARPDLLPLEYITELQKLQDRVPPFETEQVIEILEKELDSSLDSIFEYFDTTPLAAASVGQVHRARLTTGEDVVVKIQRPEIEETVEVDLEIMMHLATLAEIHLEGWEVHRPSKVVEEFAYSISAELDYTIEAAQQERFIYEFRDDPTVRVPTVYHDYCSRRVLTMEFINGIKVSDIAKIKEAGMDPHEIARRGADLILKQVFVSGFFHADPHPGNFFVLADHIICFLDFGVIGRITKSEQNSLADLIVGISRRDPTASASALLRLTSYETDPDANQFERDVAAIIEQHFYRPVKDINFSKFIQQVLVTAAKHQLTIIPNVFVMLKSIGTVDQLARQLDPNFDITHHAEPFIREIQLKRYHPYHVAKEVLQTSGEFLNMIQALPSDVRTILRLAKRGKIHIEFEHRGLEPMLRTHERISNRITYSVVVAAMLIGSSIIVLSGVPPFWHEIPVLGLIGFAISSILGLSLLLRIIRSGGV